MNEYRCYGPPGTGKTTWLSRLIEDRAKKFGSESVVVTSFTRAAALELVGRNLPVPEGRVGTLHALCYRDMGRPTIAETRVQEWNAQANLMEVLSNEKVSVDEPSEYEGKGAGDPIMRHCQVLRARMVPQSVWPASILGMYHRWCEWKAENDYIDFTDMIEYGLREMDTAPGVPKFLCSDESQDFSALELSLLRKWGQETEDFVIVGDGDQCLYYFKGSSPIAFLTPELPRDHEHFLTLSHRVPRAVHKVSQDWIKQISSRKDKPYKPRDADGVVEYRHELTWRDPDRIVRLLSGSEGTTMVLTSCAYMLVPLLSALREGGIPFYNPYRITRGDWNPLRGKIIQGILSFLRPDPQVWGSAARRWTYTDLKDWLPLIKSEGNLRRGAKKKVGERTGEVELGVLLAELFQEQALTHAYGLDLDWFRDNLLKDRPYPFEVVKAHGAAMLKQPPRIIIGTIHSVKGGEADNVVLFPDLSPNGMRSWLGASRDEVIRQFYVGMTRARDRLYLGQAANRAFRVSWDLTTSAYSDIIVV